MSDAIDKTAHVEIIDNPDVREFLSKCRYMVEPSGKEAKEVATYTLSKTGGQGAIQEGLHILKKLNLI